MEVETLGLIWPLKVGTHGWTSRRDLLQRLVPCNVYGNSCRDKSFEGFTRGGLLIAK